MKLSTATTFDTSKYEEIGIVRGIATRSISLLRDVVSSFTSVVGGKMRLIQSRLIRGYDESIEDLQANAEKMGADMVIGIDIDIHDYAPTKNGIFAILATGTALRLKKSEPEPAAEAGIEGGRRRRKTHRRKHL